MPISMYTVSVPVFVQHLNALSAILDKAAAFAEAKKFDPSVLLNMRLYPDMYPMVKQVQEATRHAVRVTGLLAGIQAPDLPNTETSIPELKARIAKAVDFLNSVKPAQIEGTEDKEIKIAFSSGERTYTGHSLLMTHSLPNFFFHCTTAYDLLRQVGIDIGKRDFMGRPPRT
ncbi:MAG TPA: DUF1993 domain-containing protein [Xanthobacteraceae bacterium]|nr:DUF1993 domain-containing protein [Xanthobacteraceae bacterium]